MMERETLKQRLAARVPLVGTFIKTPALAVAEILARSDLDLLCIDGEHAPFEMHALDVAIFACRASGKPVIVRVPTGAPSAILAALDLGAAGVLVPHVITAAEAEALVRCAHYGPSGRSYAASTRAGGFGSRGMADHLSRSSEETLVIAQIEDAKALDELDAILAVRGLDAIFVGPADLAVSMGESSPSTPKVVAAVERICAAAAAHARPVGLFVGDAAEVPDWIDRGVTLFLMGSDHSILASGAASLAERFHKALGTGVGARSRQ